MKIRNSLLSFILTLFLSIIINAQTSNVKIQGFVERGGGDVQVTATKKYETQYSYPNSTVTVYLTGTLTLATIYSDLAGTIPKANPFTADVNAHYFFYIATGTTVDIKFSGSGITSPFTTSEVYAALVSGGGGSGAAGTYYCDSTKGCFDPNASPYNCTVDNSSLDSTSCIQSVFNAAASWSTSNGGKMADIPFDDGVYYIKSALTVNANCNSQVCFPTSVYTSPGAVRVRSKGNGIFAIGHFNSNGNSPLTFISTLTGQSYSGTHGWPGVFGSKQPEKCAGWTNWTNNTSACAIADQNWIFWNFEGVSVRQQVNPSLASIDARGLNRFRIANSRIDVVPAAYTLPATYTYGTNPTGVGIMMPTNNADAGIYEGWFEIAGYYGCMGVSETTSMSGHIQNMYCRVGEFIQAPFHHMPAIMGDVYDVRNEHGVGYIHPTTGVTSFPVGLLHTYLTHVKFAFISFENDASPPYYANRVSHVNDPTNNLRLTGSWAVVKGNVGGHGLPLIRNGARNVDVHRFVSEFNPDIPNQTIILDEFNAADGTAITSRKPDIDKPNASWATIGAATGFNIVGNHAVGITNGADNFLQIDSGVSDATIKSSFFFTSGVGSQAIGLVFRYTDANNFWYFQIEQSPSSFKVFKRVAGVTTNVANFSPDTLYFPINNLEENTFRVNLTGNSIQIIMNYAVMYNATDSFNATATKHGIYAYGNAGMIEDFQILR